MSKISKSKNIYFIILFSISMAMMEAAVVIYLRIIFYPSHFDFPMVAIPGMVMATELSRELATILMLISIGYIAAQNAASRFACFLLSFAVWDIFYYAFLYLFLNWPKSILGWDILFLIPIPWYGPVLSPIIVSLCMVGLAVVILYAQTKTFILRTNIAERLLLLAGCLLILFTYTSDFLLYVYKRHVDLQLAFTLFMPDTYNWPVFGFGIVLIITGILSYLKRIKRTDGERIHAMY